MLVLTLLFIQLGIFVALALFLRYVLTRHVSSASSHLEELTQECSKKLDEAKRRKEDADKFYSDTLVKAKEEGEKLKVNLMQEGQTEKDKIIRDGREQSEDLMRRAKSAAETIVNEMEDKVRMLAVEKAREVASEMLQGKLGEEAHVHWVDELLKQGFDGLSRLNVPEDIKNVEISTPYALKAAQSKTIRERLNGQIGRSVQVTEKVDPALILGVRLTVGNIVIDGSLQGKIQDWTRHATQSSH